MGIACGACGTEVKQVGALCPTCHEPVAAPPRVHLAPDGGLQTYVEPYPGMHAGGSSRRAYLAARQVVTIAAERGEWVQVFVDGVDAGWVDGRRLVPPVNGIGSYRAPTGPTGPVAVAPPASAAPSNAVTVDLFAGVLASAGIVLGAVLSWTQGVSVSSFSIPVQFLFEPHTTARNPRLGWFLISFGILGLVVTFVQAARLWRVVLGALTTVAAVVYMGQIAAALPKGLDLTDAIGAGVWVTLISGVGLMLSAAFVPHERL
jgi:hypothetical protein